MWIVAAIAALLAKTDPPARTADAYLPPVVLVHGIHGTGKDMVRLAGLLQADGRRVFIPTLQNANGTVPIEQLSDQLERYIREEVRSECIDLVGYSMGGIVSRHYGQRKDKSAKIRHLVTLSSPHHGTWTAHIHFGPATRQMRRGSEFLKQLDNAHRDPSAPRLISFWTATDLIILPASSSKVEGASNRHHWGLGHISFILEKRHIMKVVAALRE